MTQAPKGRPGLGRGLGELLQRTDPELEPRANRLASGARFAEIAVADVEPNPKQPRTVFDEEPLDELAESIREVGLLQPIVVRPVADKYELVMGERRLRAAKLAGLERIPAIVRETAEHDLLRDALLENLHRVQLNPLEEAAAYQQLLSDFGCTQEELAKRIKKSRPQVSNTIRLLQLPAPVQRKVAAGVISAGHARALLGLPDAAAMDRLATRIVAEGLSVRSVEELVSVGEAEPKQPTQRKQAASSASDLMSQVQSDLSERLDTRVTVAGSPKRGRIVIEYAGEDDLRRLSDILIQK
ncbi:MAG: ParB/RepB/Spo0J family partition protein [Propionibacteriaceae bacterium]|jgi:ParB family chromosome partitioning protein|nr:ParB/RepB/Spo0J family partition protein [Propionibacteriaceae bacterium]